MTQAHEVTFNPNAVQRRFLESRAKADLFSSRMGEGKSTALCWAALYHTRHNPGARWDLVRDTWENMQATTMKTFFEWFPPGVFGTFHHTKRTFTWAEGVAKGEVEFLGMDDPQDASKLMSRELAGFAIDEPAPAIGSAGVDELIFDIGMSRLRQPGMKWYCAKLAENNPDESHWTHRRFVQPGTEGFVLWQPDVPENTQNLPPEYYAELRRIWQHRPDLVRRFVEGEFGYQQQGKPVTPQWSDKIHLSNGLAPLRRIELRLLWDFGLNPTCIITQVTPLGQWLILDSVVGDGIGVEELIFDTVKPLLADRYPKMALRHIGDPAGRQREQSSSGRSAVRSLQRELGGSFRAGPIMPAERIEPLRAVLSRTINGRGVVQVDRFRAPEVWQALRGGWHHHVARTGIVSGKAAKDIHSHPGDAMSYGAAILFPMGRLMKRGKAKPPQQAGYFGSGPSGLGRPGLIMPEHGSLMSMKGGLQHGDKFQP